MGILKPQFQRVDFDRIKVGVFNQQIDAERLSRKNLAGSVKKYLRPSHMQRRPGKTELEMGFRVREKHFSSPR
jgi:hypothetical protein